MNIIITFSNKITFFTYFNFISICVNTFGTSEKSEEELVELIKNKFDLTPAGIIEYLKLKEPIYTKTTNYGHFGKKDLPWEKIVEI